MHPSRPAPAGHLIEDFAAGRAQRPPVVLASPHSGRDYPEAFLAASIADLAALRRAEDAHVDDLVRPVARKLGLPLLSAHWGRTFVDLNRAADELDPTIVEGAPARQPSARVRAGLGVLPRVATPGVPIYRQPITLAEARARIEDVHEPYHRALGALLAQARAANGIAILIDCHSMPSLPRKGGHEGAAFVLGDRHGVSADDVLVSAAERALARTRRCVRNRPYSGGHATQRHGRPAMATHAIQLETDRALYLRAGTVDPLPDFGGTRACVETMLHAVLNAAEQLIRSPARLAAE